jgi:hypothetical protein
VRWFEFGSEWHFYALTIPLAAHPGSNVVRLEFANVNEGGPARSALFRRLQIVPTAWVETDRPAGSGPRARP